LEPKAADEIRRLYREHRHPLDPPQNDPVVMGYRYQIERAKQAGNRFRENELNEKLQRLTAER
jgi:hypothetical protein